MAMVVVGAAVRMRPMRAVVTHNLDDLDDFFVVVVLQAVRPAVGTAVAVVGTAVRVVGTMLVLVEGLDLDVDFILLGFLPLGTSTARRRRALVSRTRKLYLDRDSIAALALGMFLVLGARR